MEFAGEWVLKDIGHQIDPKQFGCICDSPTTLRLLDMFHSWLSKQEADGCLLQIVELDFSKALDRIIWDVFIIIS